MRKEKGFTLIELLVVIAIIAILAIAITVGYQSIRKSAANAKRIETAQAIATAEELYYNDNTEYTGSIGALVSGGYLQTNPDDSSVYGPDYSPDSTATWQQYLKANTQKFVIRVNTDNNVWFCCNEGGCQNDLEYGSDEYRSDCLIN